MSHPHNRFLHVANGTSTTNTLEAAGVPGTCSIWADPLYEGPVPGGLTDDALIDVRTQYLAGAEPDPVNDMREWRAAIARHESYDELVLWYEHDLFDQLNLLQLLTWIRHHLPETKPVTLICIGEIPGTAGLQGSGRAAGGGTGAAPRRKAAGDRFAGTRWRNARGRPSVHQRLKRWTRFGRAIPRRCRFSLPRSRVSFRIPVDTRRAVTHGTAPPRTGSGRARSHC